MQLRGEFKRASFPNLYANSENNAGSGQRGINDSANNLITIKLYEKQDNRNPSPGWDGSLRNAPE